MTDIPRNFLIVSASPSQTSLTSSLAEYCKDVAIGRGSKVSHINLYAERFDPVLSEVERNNYYTVKRIDPIVCGMAAKVAEADVILLIFPTWWGGFPAILKGWFDRIWAPYIAFDFSPEAGMTGRLDNLEKLIVVTTWALPSWIDRFVLLSAMKRTLKHLIIRAGAPQCRVKYLAIYSVNKTPDRQLQRVKAKLQKLVV